MAIRKVMRLGHPILRRLAEPVDTAWIGSEAFKALVLDMEETLAEYGGIGLAAPQIAEPLRLAIIQLPGGNSRYGEIPTIPLTVFVNPKITVLDPQEAGYWEGCLSVPGMRGFVERPQHIRVDYLDESGESASLELQGFPATVFQHEFDHLDGVLYVDRLSDSTSLMFEEEFVRFHADND